MTILGNVSLLAQSTLQSGRLNDLRSLMDDLSRQVTTQKKFDDYAGFGTSALDVQRLRGQKPLIQTYMNNIDRVSTRMTLMNTSLSNISKIGTSLVSSIQTLIQNGPASINSIQQVSRQGLQTIEELLNQNIDGHYLFAGSDVNNPPFLDDSTLNSNFVTQINSWLATGDNTTLINNTDGFSGTALGLSSGLAASGNVTARVDDSLDIDYTIKADQPGIRDILRGLAFVANLPIPAATDTATRADFNTIMLHILPTVQNAVQEVNGISQQLAGKFNLLKTIKDNHQSDLDLVQTQIDKIENVDPASALTQMQALQTQLTASYQVTKVVSQMSLTNFF